MFKNEWWLEPPCDEFYEEWKEDDGEDALQDYLDKKERSFDEYAIKV